MKLNSGETIWNARKTKNQDEYMLCCFLSLKFVKILKDSNKIELKEISEIKLRGKRVYNAIEYETD